MLDAIVGDAKEALLTSAGILLLFALPGPIKIWGAVFNAVLFPGGLWPLASTSFPEALGVGWLNV